MPDYSRFLSCFRFCLLAVRFNPPFTVSNGRPAPFRAAPFRCCLRDVLLIFILPSRSVPSRSVSHQSDTCTSRSQVDLHESDHNYYLSVGSHLGHVFGPRTATFHKSTNAPSPPRLVSTLPRGRTPSRCATNWLSSTRHADASTTNMLLTGAPPMVGQATASNYEQSSSATLAVTTHHTLAVTTTPLTPRITRTRATTRARGAPPRAPAATTDEEYCL